MEHPDIAGLSEWKLLARADAHRGLAGSPAVSGPSGRGQGFPARAGGRVSDAVSCARRPLLGRLSDHPGMVTAYDADTLPDGRPYLIMELCPGGSLTEWLKPANRPGEEQVRQVGLRIADALAAAHASGVLHRDVTPANILIGDDGDPRLADFGLLALLGADADPAETPPVPSSYAPPEALRMQPATESSDVFSLAATLFALLAGSPPRPVESAPVTPIPGVSRGLMDVVLAALAEDPAARPTAARFFGQLARVPLRTSNAGALPAPPKLRPASQHRRAADAGSRSWPSPRWWS